VTKISVSVIACVPQPNPRRRSAQVASDRRLERFQQDDRRWSSQAVAFVQSSTRMIFWTQTLKIYLTLHLDSHVICLHICYIVGAECGWNRTLFAFARVIKMYTVVYFFPGHSICVKVAKDVKLNVVHLLPSGSIPSCYSLTQCAVSPGQRTSASTLFVSSSSCCHLRNVFGFKLWTSLHHPA